VLEVAWERGVLLWGVLGCGVVGGGWFVVLVFVVWWGGVVSCLWLVFDLCVCGFSCRGGWLGVVVGVGVVLVVFGVLVFVFLCVCFLFMCLCLWLCCVLCGFVGVVWLLWVI